MMGGWPLTIAIVTLVGALTSGLVTYIVQHRYDARKLRREGYGEAVAALYAWYEYPFQIRRRLSDSEETLDRLIQIGNKNQQRIARSLAWMALDSIVSYIRYQELVEKVKEGVAKHIQEAWSVSFIQRPEDINLGSWGPESIDSMVKEFLDNISPTKLKYLKKFANWLARVKNRRDAKSDSKGSEVEGIKRNEDKYITRNDMRRMITDRLIGSVGGFILAGILGVSIVFSNRYIDLNSMEGQSIISFWSMTITLMSSHILIFAFEWSSRGHLKNTKTPLKYKNIVYGALISFLALFGPIMFFAWLVAIFN